MLIAISILSALTMLCAIGWRHCVVTARHAEDNWNIVFFVIGTVVFGAIDFVLIIVWLAIT